MSLRVFSFGGGVQSTAALVLAARGEIDFKTFLFANVGDDAENPATLDYFFEHAGPYAERHGIAIHELRRQRRNGQTVDLYRELLRDDISATRIPVRLTPSGTPGHRDCTVAFKIRVVDRWLREHGASRTNIATVGLGISLDEFQRARTAEDSRSPYRLREYPLIALRLDRAQCVAIIQRAGLPVPPKSSCWFCPFKRMSTWQEMRHTEPELFDKAVSLEVTINRRRERQGREPVYLTDKLVPLDQATSPHRQLPMFTDEADDACESGYCMV